MKQTEIGRGGPRVSRVVMGSMALGAARTDESRYRRTLHAGLDAGINAIDTAPLYDLGVCQERVGRVLSERSERVAVFSKVGLRWTDSYGTLMFETRDRWGRRVAVRHDSRPVSVRRDVHESLRRLDVERLDLVHVHQYDRLTPIADTMGALKDLLREGKIGAIGLSTDFGPAQVRAAQRELGDVPLTSLLLNYNAVERGCERELFPIARRDGIGVLAHTCLARGLLTSAASQGRRRFAGSDFRAADYHFHPENVQRVLARLHQDVAPIARARGITIAQTMLAWALSHASIDAVVVGASRPSQVRQNVEAEQVELSAHELWAIGRAFRRLHLDPLAGCSLRQRAGIAVGRLRRKALNRLVRAVGLPEHLRSRPQ